jgi:pyruvate dehydrogenase E1 component alpha subunit
MSDASRPSWFFDPGTLPTGMARVLEPDGSLVPGHGLDVGLKREDLEEIYRLMVVARRLDLEGANLQRQGELALYVPYLGEEAALIGSAYALEHKDWIFHYGREHAVGLVRGVDPSDMMQVWRGTWHGGLWDPHEHSIAPYAIPIATQIPHAVGFAMAAKLDRSDGLAIAYFGDGATSEGDFHEACNLAGVWKAPVILFCRNDQYAISLPLSKQTASSSIACKALAYGLPGVRVDGNDVLAVHAVTKEAAHRARAGDGPTLIEAVTYRRGPHSSADDPTRYRSAKELERWEALDPIERLRRYLEREGILTEELAARCEADASRAAQRVRDDIVGAPPLPVEDLFDLVYAQSHSLLERQRAAFLEERARNRG